MAKTTIHSILEEFREAAVSNRDLGDKFERLIKSYLLTDPTYKDQFSDVWLWNEWPGRGKHTDTGIDLVAKERDSEGFCAIQCKFFDPAYSLQKSDIDSFFTASGKEPFTRRMIVSTTDKWSNHAEEALEHQRIPVTRLRVQDLDNSPVDWAHYSLAHPQQIKLKEKKKLREHQKEALTKVMEGLKKDDRGKLIMACGTGKTFTALKIAEKMTKDKGTVLFLVPSISLLSQTLKEWTAEAEVSLHCFAVCSDTKVGRQNEDISIHDLALPATTDAKRLAAHLKAFVGKRQLTAVFGTYQSIKVISEAQKMGAPSFDLVICDEAHRTTGVTLEEDLGDESYFVKVHDEKYLKADKRLYMTATPRIYSDDSKAKAEENDAVLCSMDDESYYGKELHRLDFSEAVRRDLLSDYKVMVLAVDEKYVNKSLQNMLADENNELKLEDAVKITGCWNGLSKRFAAESAGDGIEVDSAHMHRAVAFCRSIKDSQKIANLFSSIVSQYRLQHQDEYNWLSCEVEHVDGTFNALERNKKLDWLKEDTSEKGNVCRILSNARCLAEGVDVPALDAVMFLNPRNSVVDVVQSVGRVMRKAEGKKYGYIILPIGVPANTPPDEALADNKKYKVVWQVLQALRAHDNRFNATVNQIELNKNRPEQIQVIGVGGGPADGEGKPGEVREQSTQYALPFPDIEEWRNAIYAKIVIKCGDRRYWESWAKDVAEIAERHRARMEGLLKGAKPKHKAAFDEFLKGLQENLNPSIDQDDAIEMLSQHLITKPVFDALFEGYHFSQENPVSIAMQKMVELLEGESLEKETANLDKFYASVRERAKGVDNAEGKQRIIIELYDKFFKTAFPRMAERLGIVYTPVEVVDFIIKSADDALRQEFGVGLTDKGVNILDPFTGTGTFIVRLLQNGLIKPEDLRRKYREELHANEIILLAYYIAAINIEEAFYAVADGKYEPFDGIVLTDTFQSAEPKNDMEEKYFPENNKRVARQKKKDIRVIIGNPPYSAGQTSENDANKNLKYPALDERIRSTYVEHSTATLKNSLYDSYIRSFRWASDRIGEKGIVCFVSNGSFIDGNAMDGFRKCLAEEFTSIYCFNLRGNQRTQGEVSRREGGKIFGSGSRASIAITLLVKNPVKKGAVKLFYHDIGDYLPREKKLEIIREFGSLKNIPWVSITPNDSFDWINQGDPSFNGFASLLNESDSIFESYSNGLNTARDAWVYNFSKQSLSKNMERMIDFYNLQMSRYKRENKNGREDVDKILDLDSKKISWSADLKKDVVRNKNHKFDKKCITQGMYRPFCKEWLYFSKDLNERVGSLPEMFGNGEKSSLVIFITGLGASKEFSSLILDSIPNRHLLDTGLCFPLIGAKDYDESHADNHSLPGFNSTTGTRTSNLRKEFVSKTQSHYGKAVGEEDIFYYVYGMFHSVEYKTRFQSDLKKSMPRIPLAKEFLAFSKAGRELAKWHLNYETVKPYTLKEEKDELALNPKELFKVKKMVFGKRDGEVDKTTIVFNSHITLKGIPLEAYEYVVNGRPALEWIMERYQVTTDQDSQITNDPNDWSEDPRYIIDLVKRIVTVSLETMKIVKALPPLNEMK